MMRSVPRIILLAFVAQAHAKEVAENHIGNNQDAMVKLVDEVVDMLHDRILRASPVQHKDLDDTTLGKVTPSGNLAMRSSTGPLSAAKSRPGLFSSSGAVFQPRAVHRDNDVQPLPDTAQPISRRQASLAAALAGLAAPVLQPNSALAANLFGRPEAKKAPIDEGFSTGPMGIKYYDLLSGPADGAPAKAGSTIRAYYDLKVANPKPPATGATLEEVESYKFTGGDGKMPILKTGGAPKTVLAKGWDLAVLGGGDMPPMKPGDLREVLIPPELAWGAEGQKCAASANCPGGYVIPPDSLIKYTIICKSVKGGE
jgi:hypothetical protein